MSENFTPVPADDWLRKSNWDHKYRHQNMSVDMDVWYPMLKEITFKTYFIHIRYCEAEAIINYHNAKIKKRKDLLSKKDTKILLELQDKIDYFFNTYEDLKHGAMFRLTGRSGKDSDYYNNEEIYNLYLENLEKVSKKYNMDKTNPNLRYIAIITLMNRFKVNNGKDALNVLLTSQRLFLDMKDWLQHGGKEQIVLRKWDDSLVSEREFRCFVVNNQLKAICQDERYAFFPDLLKNKNLYEKLINEYFNNTFKSYMKIPNYVVDFAILKNNEIKLIEFSPFLRCTSARFFRWDANYEEMLNGSGKLTIREKPHPDIEMFVEDWEYEIGKKSQHFDDYFSYDNYKDKIYNYLSYINPLNIYNYFFNSNNDNKFKNRIVFVASVLKNNFYWSKKYITYEEKNNDANKNKLLGKAILENHIISIDKNGFGWIIPKNGKKCFGEVYDLLYEDFLDIEFFYGQTDTKMEEISVILNGEEIKAYAYIVKEMWKNVNNKNKEEELEVEEYILEIQEEKFNPMGHIINQQERYLNMSLDFDLKDSW